jgi:hypothetical protein
MFFNLLQKDSLINLKDIGEFLPYHNSLPSSPKTESTDKLNSDGTGKKLLIWVPLDRFPSGKQFYLDWNMILSIIHEK